MQFTWKLGTKRLTVIKKVQWKHVQILKFRGPELCFPEILCPCTFTPKETPFETRTVLWLQAEVCTRHCLRAAWDAVVGTDITSDGRRLLKCPATFVYILFLICPFVKLIHSNIRTWKFALDFPPGMWTTLNSGRLYRDGQISASFYSFRPLTICGVMS